VNLPEILRSESPIPSLPFGALHDEDMLEALLMRLDIWGVVKLFGCGMSANEAVRHVAATLDNSVLNSCLTSIETHIDPLFKSDGV